MTIRLRLTLWYTALLGTTLILFSVIVYSALATNLRAQLEQDARRDIGKVTSALAADLQKDIRGIRDDPTLLDYLITDLFASASGIQVVTLDGMIHMRSSNLGQTPIHGYRDAMPRIRSGSDHKYYILEGSEAQFLVYSVPLTVNNRLLGTVQLIKSVSTVNDTLKQVRRYLILGTGLSLILAAIIGAFLAKRALSQIDAITKTAGGITRTKDLGQRLTITETNSEVGRLAETFNAMLDQIQALFNTQKRLVADVSHELRTPLTTVQGNVEYLQRMVATTASKDVLDDKTTADLQEVLGEVESETARMGTMIGDLLLLAQADSGALQLEMQAVEMDTLLLDVFRQTQRLADRRKGKDLLNVRLGSEDQALVCGDRERLRQLLLNLADNAIKYTPAGGTITLGLKIEDGWVQIYVSDTGIGIPEDQQKFIFDRFYRTDKARSRELGGSGLGLSIVAWIVEAHNGHIDVASSPQKGSTFSVWLPALADEDALEQPEGVDVGG